MALHRCDNKGCVNPEHLYAGTKADNGRDAFGRGRWKPPMISGEAHANAKLTDAQVSAIRDDSRTYAAISASFGISQSQISNIKRGAQRNPDGWTPSEKRTSSKLTLANATEIRRRYAAGGISQEALAKEYGVHQGTISNIIRRKYYAQTAVDFR
jgi:transcriptional regulator with XRE-family HTH domain